MLQSEESKVQVINRDVIKLHFHLFLLLKKESNRDKQNPPRAIIARKSAQETLRHSHSHSQACTHLITKK